MENRLLPVGKQNFREIRQNGYAYVDKTRYVWELARTGLSYFLFRPRRFGKSLFVSTIESYFSGDKELFKGLYIEEKENARGQDAWTKHPVMSFSLSGGDYNSPIGLADILNNALNACMDKYHLDRSLITGETLPVRFQSTIEQLYKATGRRVVVLVDEYDKPLLATMSSNPEQEERNREICKGFFSALKDMDGFLRFVFFTGVTKSATLSIFSDLNQLLDISMDDEYSGICGFTEDEALSEFKPEIEALSKAQGMAQDECLGELGKMYYGYRFSKNEAGVYNPFSLLNAFARRDFGSYWFGSGTPDILVKKLRQSKMPLYKLADGVNAKGSELKDYRWEDPDPVPLLYQSGYLTICGYDRRFENYKLRLPNGEVKYGLLNSLANDVLGPNSTEQILTIDHLIINLESGDLDSFFKNLQAFFASIPYPEEKTQQYEEEWSGQLFLILSLMGAYASCEVRMAADRADFVFMSPDYVYAFEFELDAPIEDAINQIDDKVYAIPHADDSRKLIKVGVVFSTEKRNVLAWKAIAAN